MDLVGHSHSFWLQLTQHLLSSACSGHIEKSLARLDSSRLALELGCINLVFSAGFVPPWIEEPLNLCVLPILCSLSLLHISSLYLTLISPHSCNPTFRFLLVLISWTKHKIRLTFKHLSADTGHLCMSAFHIWHLVVQPQNSINPWNSE